MRAPEKMAEDGRFTPRKWQRLFNQLRAYAATLEIAEGVGYRRKRTARGTILDIIQDGSTPPTDASVKLFEITALHEDYLACKGVSYDASGTKTLETTVTNVAKPSKLRQLALSGVTVGGITYSFASTNARTRTFATLGGISGVPISDVLFPLYAVGDEIVAADLSASKTSATINGSPGGTRFDWEDLNVDAREWVLPETVVQICILVNNVPTTRKILIRGSAVFG